MTADHDPPGEALLTVHVLGVPVDLQQRAQQHNEGLMRELTLIAEQLRRHGAVGELPVRLVTLVDRLSQQYAGLSEEQEQQLEDAFASGAETVDLTYRLPLTAAPAARDLGQMLDEADEYCREGRHLLTLASPPDVLAYRRWFLSEFTEQAAGRAPVPWAR